MVAGDDLLSPLRNTIGVQGLTAEFGMGSGMAPALFSPAIFHVLCSASGWRLAGSDGVGADEDTRLRRPADALHVRNGSVREYCEWRTVWITGVIDSRE